MSEVNADSRVKSVKSEQTVSIEQISQVGSINIHSLPNNLSTNYGESIIVLDE